MLAVVFAIKDFIVDTNRDIDLTSIPEAEAVALIKRSYGFLSSMVEVSIVNGVATVILPDEKVESGGEALRWFEHGLRHAQQGNYKRAIQLFKRVLERLPNHIAARRNLAMAYLESGDKDQAFNHLIQVLRLDPKDVWSYILLGNLHSKYENNFERAEKWYRKAFELDPQDAILLTNYGALMLNSLEVSATSQMAWRHQRDRHIIRYRNKTNTVTPHLLAHELEHLELEYRARKVGRNHSFSTTEQTRERAIRTIRDDISRLRTKELDEKTLTEYITKLIDGMTLHLFNTPLDMLIEHRLYHQFAELRSSQFVSLYMFQVENVQPFMRDDVKQMSPRRIWKATLPSIALPPCL